MAVHEAGHAVAAHVLGKVVEDIRLLTRSNGGFEGKCLADWPESASANTQDAQRRADAIVTAAGVAAEQVVYGGNPQWDKGEYLNFFYLASSPPKGPDLRDELYDEACRILRKDLSAVKTLSNILMERHRLRGPRSIAEVIDTAVGERQGKDGR